MAAEARAAAALDHPNIGVVHEIGETEEGQPFIAMAYYDGETLAERLRRETLPVRDALRVIRQVVRGLGAAHAQGCVHCDIKPSNILVTRSGLQSPDGTVVKILDFGIARHLGDGPMAPRSVAGTAGYQAPERTRGEPASVRADLWSVGVVLYEMLTGRLPFTPGPDRSFVDAVRHQEPEPVENLRPDVPPVVDQIIRRCLQKDPDRRYADTGALLADLDRLEPSRPPEGRPRRSGSGSTSTANRLAVLPLADARRESGHDDVAVDMTQALISQLSRLRGLRVIGGAASMPYQPVVKVPAQHRGRRGAPLARRDD